MVEKVDYERVHTFQLNDHEAMLLGVLCGRIGGSHEHPIRALTDKILGYVQENIGRVYTHPLNQLIQTGNSFYIS